jgi:hypothetical protein
VYLGVDQIGLPGLHFRRRGFSEPNALMHVPPAVSPRAGHPDAPSTLRSVAP